MYFSVLSPIHGIHGIHHQLLSIARNKWFQLDNRYELKLSVSLTIMAEDYLQTCKNRRSASRVVLPSFRPRPSASASVRPPVRPTSGRLRVRLFLSFFPDGFAWLFEFPSILPGPLQIPNSSASRSVGRSVGRPRPAATPLVERSVRSTT